MGKVLQLRAEVVEPSELTFGESPHEQQTERLIVREVVATDYIWNEQYRAYMPVFGSVHGHPEIERQLRADSTAKPSPVAALRAKLRGDKGLPP